MRKKSSIYDLEKELVLEAFRKSRSLPEVFAILGFPSNSTSYRFARNFAQDNNVKLPKADRAYRAEAARLAGAKRRSIPNQEVFRERSPYTRGMVKQRALEAGYLEYRCYGSYCKTNQISLNGWAGIRLQLEHKNGIGDDNRIENIELLCPNCHSLTSTFGSGNSTRYENGAHGACENCGRHSTTKLCLKCQPTKRTLTSVSLEALAQDIENRGLSAVAKDYDMTAASLKQAIKYRLRSVLTDLDSGGIDLLPDGQNDINYVVLRNAPKKKEVVYPPVDELLVAVADRGFVRVAESLNVSDKGLRKHMLGFLGSDHDVFDVKARKRFRSATV